MVSLEKCSLLLKSEQGEEPIGFTLFSVEPLNETKFRTVYMLTFKHFIFTNLNNSIIKCMLNNI